MIGKERSFTKSYPGWYKPESSDVSKLNLTVKCGPRDHTLPDCTEATSPCLFNVIDDPCEFNNIAGKHSDMVERMVTRLLEVASKYVWVTYLSYMYMVTTCIYKCGILSL